MAKKVQGYVKVNVAATQANPASLGSTLGPTGVSIMDFCKQFNAATQGTEAGIPIPVVITIYADRSFSFIMKTPPVTYFLKKATGLTSGSKEPGRKIAGKITMAQIHEIAEKKMKDLNAFDMDAAAEMIKGSARSMGLEVVEK